MKSIGLGHEDSVDGERESVSTYFMCVVILCLGREEGAPRRLLLLAV